MADAGGEPPRPPRQWCDYCERPGHSLDDCRALARTLYVLNRRALGLDPSSEPWKNRRGTRAGRAKREKRERRNVAASAAAVTTSAPATETPSCAPAAANPACAAAASGVSSAPGTGVVQIPEGLTPAGRQELVQTLNMVIAQFMSARPVGATSRGDGHRRQPEQGDPDVGQKSPGVKEEKDD